MWHRVALATGRVSRTRHWHICLQTGSAVCPKRPFAMDRFIPLHASPSHEFEVSEPGRVHTLATTVAGGLRADNMTLTAAPSAAVSWTHGGIGTNRLHSHLLQRELLGSGHVSVAASPSSSPGHRSAATGLLLARESDASHWSVGGPLDTAQPGAAAPEGVSDQSQRPRATGVAAEARAAVLLSTPPRHRVLHFGSPGSGRRMATQSDTDSSIELDSSFESGAGGRGLTAALAAASPAPSYDADENLGRRGGGGSGLDWGAAAAAAVAGSPGAQSSRMSTMSTATGSSGGASSTMSPLAMASAAAAVIRRQGLVGLSAGSEELLRSPKRTRRKISRVPYKARTDRQADAAGVVLTPPHHHHSHRPPCRCSTRLRWWTTSTSTCSPGHRQTSSRSPSPETSTPGRAARPRCGLLACRPALLSFSQHQQQPAPRRR